MRVRSPRESFRRRGTPYRAGRPGLRRGAAGRRQCRSRAARHRPARPAADQLGQRAGPRALPAAVLAARELRQRPARPRRLGTPERAPPVRVLGARGLAAAARHAAAAALAHAARRAPTSGDGKGKLHLFRREKKAYIDEVRREIEDRGPLAASELSNGGPGRGAWWGWSDGKLALEWLFFAGRAHDGDAARHLRARLRPHRARAAGSDPGDADAVGRGGAARALADVGAGARRRHRVRPARLFPAGRRRHQGAAGRAGRGGRPAAGDGRGLGQARLSRSRARASRAGSRRAPCSRRSIRWSGSATARTASSTSSIASRSTRRSPSALTAITSCPSCSATGWSAGSTSSRTAPTASCWPMPCISRRCRSPAGRGGRCDEELRLMADWLGLETRGERKRTMNDLVLKGGRVIDPSQGLDRVTDIAFAGGKVAAIGDGLSGTDTRDVARQDRLARPDRPAHACLLGRHLARRRGRAAGAHRRRHHLRRCRQRRARQFPRLPQPRDRALAGPHPALPQHLLPRHLRLLQDGDGRRERRHAPDRPARGRAGRARAQGPGARHQGAGRQVGQRRLRASCRWTSRSTSPRSAACRSWRISTPRRRRATR